MIKGIDISKHNGKIDWSKVVSDFVMMRAGYGRNNIDAKLYDNIRGCQQYNIPFGFYWFSYALSTNDAYHEAEYLCNIADKYKPVYPLAFDWEYDSDNYAKKKGVKITNDLRVKIAETFLNRVEERGYFAINYTNKDYYQNKGFNRLNKFGLWLADWNGNKPFIQPIIWQYNEKGKVKGIAGYTDLNISYRDFTDKESRKNPPIDDEKLEIVEENVYNDYIKEKYRTCAISVLLGAYGNGEERKKKLQSAGYDYEFIQKIMNEYAD